MKLLIISDAHANYEAMVTACEKEKYDEMIFLGDAVDYGPQPAETVDFLLENSKYNLMGNHDYAVLTDTDCHCSPAMHDLSEFTRQNISYRLMSKEDVQKLNNFKTEIKADFDNITVYMTHASPYNNMYGYLFSTEAEMVYRDEKFKEYSYIMIGHTHYPMYYKGRIVNPGSVGQPRDGNWMPQYAIFDTDSRDMTFKRFRYDNEKTLKLLKELLQDNNSVYEQLKKYYS